MEEAVAYFDNESDEEKKEHDMSELLLIKVRYFSHFASVFYIKGDYKNAKDYIDRAIAICQSGLHQTFETVESFQKQYAELQTMQIKCEAKLLGISAIDLKKRKDSAVGSVAVTTPQSSLMPLVGVFGICSSAGFLLTYTILKLRG